MKNKILVIVFLIFTFSFSIISILVPDEKISISERRKLSSFPEFSFSSDWIGDVDSYFLDHFVFRDYFRGLKAIYNYNILNKIDNNGVYLKDNYIFKSNYPTNKDSINNFNNKINLLKKNLSSNNNVYMMIIPDKNYYLKSNDFLQIDYDYIYDVVGQNNGSLIDIRDNLCLDDYYETDTHWKQERLESVVREVLNVYGYDYVDIYYDEKVFNKFYGVYYGDSAIKRNAEKLTYLDSELFDFVSVKYLENEKLDTIYNEEKLEGMDAYEVYLDGASSYIEIINEKSIYDKELVVFRDSFGSSFIPLLVPYYEKITVIDNRYVSSSVFNNYIDFSDQDVLFMYSTLLINESGSLKG